MKTKKFLHEYNPSFYRQTVLICIGIFEFLTVDFIIKVFQKPGFEKSGLLLLIMRNLSPKSQYLSFLLE